MRSYVTRANFWRAPLSVEVKLTSAEYLEGVAQRATHITWRHLRAGFANQLVRCADLQARLPESEPQEQTGKCLPQSAIDISGKQQSKKRMPPTPLSHPITSLGFHTQSAPGTLRQARGLRRRPALRTPKAWCATQAHL